MIIDSIDDCKRLKQLLGLIQSSTLPPMKGIDAFAVHNTCEWVFDQCLSFEKRELEKQETIKKGTDNGMQEKEKESSEKIVMPIMPKKKAIRKRGKK